MARPERAYAPRRRATALSGWSCREAARLPFELEAEPRFWPVADAHGTEPVRVLVDESIETARCSATRAAVVQRPVATPYPEGGTDPNLDPFAMQKVVGSSPIIRFFLLAKTPAFGAPRVGQPWQPCFGGWFCSGSTCTFTRTPWPSRPEALPRPQVRSPSGGGGRSRGRSWRSRRTGARSRR
jgi:hypothetical protein